MKAHWFIVFLLISYPLFVLSGFIHEMGHAAVADWFGIQVTGFFPTECLRLQCNMLALEPLEGRRGEAVLFAGGIAASLWWLAVYLVTMRWHRTRRWWIGGVSAAFLAGELTTAMLEGGWTWLYSNYKLLTLSIIVLAMAGGFVAQLSVTAKSFHLRQFWTWRKMS